MKSTATTTADNLFTYKRRPTLDVYGNPLYYVYPTNHELPKISGYRRNVQKGYYLVQSYNIEADLQHLAKLYLQATNKTNKTNTQPKGDN